MCFIRCAQDGLVDGDRDSADALDELAERGQKLEPVLPVVAVEDMQRGDQLLGRSIAGPLAEAVGAAMDAGGSRLDGGELGRDGHAEIVVRMGFDRQPGDAVHQADEVFDGLGQRAAHRVHDADQLGGASCIRRVRRLVRSSSRARVVS